MPEDQPTDGTQPSRAPLRINWRYLPLVLVEALAVWRHQGILAVGLLGAVGVGVGLFGCWRWRRMSPADREVFTQRSALGQFSTGWVLVPAALVALMGIAMLVIVWWSQAT